MMESHITYRIKASEEKTLYVEHFKEKVFSKKYLLLSLLLTLSELILRHCNYFSLSNPQGFGSHLNTKIITQINTDYLQRVAMKKLIIRNHPFCQQILCQIPLHTW